MDDLARQLEDARRHVRVEWSEARARRVDRAVRARLRARTAARAGAAVAAMVVAVVAGWGAARRAGVRAAWGVAGAADPRVVRLDDGSSVVPLGAQSEVRLAEVGPSRVVVRVARGVARFDVRHADARVFRVEAGDVAVQVLGTEFTVAREGAHVRVAVARGRVRVFWGGRYGDLGEGEGGEFPRAAEGAATAEGRADGAASTAEEGAPAGVAPSPPSLDATLVPVRPPLPAPSRARRGEGAARAARDAPEAPVAESWQQLAEAGDFDAAYEALHRAGAPPVRDEVPDLLLAADVARMSRHVTEAVAHLERVSRAHASDPRAPLAAFTLGRVLLDALGRPSEAAAAFARTRELDPGGSLAEDALAREVESWSRAGDGSRARALAADYLARYPDGRRALAVRHFGGLE